MKKYTFATLEKGKPGQGREVPEIVYDYIYRKGYNDGKEEGELSARKDICEARLELASLRLARLRGEAPTPDPLNVDELESYLEACRERNALPS